MEALEAILTRRSIRKYTDEPVPEELVKSLLEAAMNAPSARNTQSWHFIVVTDKKILNKVPSVHPFSDMLRHAPLAILVCGDKDIEPNDDYINENCCAATENILLAAHASGLGAVWLGVFPRKERVEGLTRLFNLPQNIVPVSMISIGYPAEKKSKENRFKQTRIHYNNW